MAIDPSIPLQTQSPNIFGAMLGSIQTIQQGQAQRANQQLQERRIALDEKQFDLEQIDAELKQAQLRAQKISQTLAPILQAPQEHQAQMYEEAKTVLQADGIDPAALPPYSPGALRSVVYRVLTTEQQLNQAAKERDDARQEAANAETKRANQMREFMDATRETHAEADRRADNTRLDAAAVEAKRHNEAMEANQRAAAARTNVPNVGSFEDFVLRKYGQNPTADQIEDARRTYQSASRPGIEIDAEMPSEFKTAIERAIGSIPAARRGTWIQTANRLWSEGNTSELKSIIKQAAIESEDVTTKSQVRNRMATVAALNDVVVMLNDLKRAGVPTGWLAGNAEDLMRRLGRSTNPQYVAIANRMADTLINYRRAATGAAFSVQESQAYERMFPNYKQQFPVNMAAVEGLLRAIGTNDRVFWENKLGASGARLVSAIEDKDDAKSTPAPAAGMTPGLQSVLQR